MLYIFLNGGIIVKKATKPICILLSLLMLMSVFAAAPFTASAAEANESVGLHIPTKGQKDKIYWTYDSESKTLTITGTGEMSFPEYWAAGGDGGSDSDIKKLVIGSGITSVSNYAFAGCSALEEIILNYGLKRIGEGAFASCTALKIWRRSIPGHFFNIISLRASPSRKV